MKTNLLQLTIICLRIPGMVPHDNEFIFGKQINYEEPNEHRAVNWNNNKNYLPFVYLLEE